MCGALVALFFTSKLLSWCVYNMTWWHCHPMGSATPFGGSKREVVANDRSTVLRFFVEKLQYAPVHVVVVGMLLAGDGWEGLPELRVLGTVQACLLAWEAVFRFGAVDLPNLFFPDRALCLLAAPLAWLHPALLYAALVSSLLLQYTISSWTLAPPYSNYLGFEFLRYSCCFLLVASCAAGVGTIDSTTAFYITLSGQVDYYFHQAAGKIRLGNTPWDWVVTNRGECILVNSYLRGWHRWLGKQGVLKAAAVMKRLRVVNGIGALAAEGGGLVALLLPGWLGQAWLCLAAGFHVIVFGVTGISVWANVVCNVVAAALLPSLPAAGVAVPLASCVVASDLLLAAFYALQDSDREDRSKVMLILFDAAYLLMCWWDSPYMRMYGYEVLTEDGARWEFPVTNFSPYDTMMTDIHTRLAYLRMHSGFDRERTRDMDAVHSGVWGLLLYRQEAAAMYALMDERQCPETLLRHSEDSGDAEPGWDISLRTCPTTHPAYPLLQFFSGFNEQLGAHPSLFKLVMQWPHFPGEDWVPDICPLKSRKFPVYNLSSPVLRARVVCYKTFYTGDDILLLEEREVGSLSVKDAGSGAVKQPETPPVPEEEFLKGINLQRRSGR